MSDGADERYAKKLAAGHPSLDFASWLVDRYRQAPNHKIQYVLIDLAPLRQVRVVASNYSCPVSLIICMYLDAQRLSFTVTE